MTTEKTTATEKPGTDHNAEFVPGNSNPANPGAWKNVSDELGKQTQNTQFSGDSETIGSSGNSGSSETANPSEKQEQQQTEEAKNKGTLGALISGKTAIEVMNIALPSAIAFVSKKVGYDISKKEFELLKSEKELIADPLQNCLNTIPFNIENPWFMLAAVLTAVYGSKFLDKSEEFKKRKKPVAIVNNQQTTNINDLKPNEPVNPIDKEIEKEFEDIKKKDLQASGKDFSNVSPENQKYERLIRKVMTDKATSRKRAIEYLQHPKRGEAVPKGYK